MGIDSLLAAQLCDTMNTQLGFSISPTVFWFSQSIHELNHYLLFEKQKMHSSFFSKNTSDAIAIVALDCVFPGAPDYDSFWKNLVAGKDAITEIPLSRWNNADYYDPYPLAPGKTNSNHGGFIALPTDFPSEHFGIKPRIADAMDPTQKIVLMATQRLLKNNSCTKTGFYIGAGFPDFMIQSVKNSPLEKTNPYSGVGMSDFSLSARAAYHFDLDGPAMVVKTACSSALTAVHLAMRALQAGDCDS
ncbi:MAG: beta-ketoacyl synthase, partial [uncultured bacterium]